MMMGVRVPGRSQATQAARTAKLGKNQQHEMVPAAEGLVIGVGIMALDDRLKPSARSV
jgi:hypothetical protein